MSLVPQTHTTVGTPIVNGVYPVTTCLNCGDSVKFHRVLGYQTLVTGSLYCAK